MWNLESTTLLVNQIKMKQIHRYREKTSAYQWGEERGVGQCTVGDSFKIIMGLYETMYVNLLKIVKHYRM